MHSAFAGLRLDEEDSRTLLEALALTCRHLELGTNA